MELNQALQVIRDRINLVDLVGRYVELRRNGNRFTAPCPFHQETKPSFSVNPEKGFFYCFGCQASGDLFEFYSRINGLDFRESVEQLAQEAGVLVDFGTASSKSARQQKEQKSEKKQILQMYEFAAEAYSQNLEKPGSVCCREYLKNRGVSEEIIEKFTLGWAPDAWDFLTDQLAKKNASMQIASVAGLVGISERGTYYDRFRKRLIFPIKNLSGQVIAFGGRIIDNSDEAKYINSAESPVYKKKEQLYGLYQARRAISALGSVFITEGYMDVLTLHQYGFINSVGVLGTALTEEQIQRLSGFCSQFDFIFDGDKPGQKAALRASEMVLARGLNCKVIVLPPEDDIDSLLKEKGTGSFDLLRLNAPAGLEFCIEALKKYAPKDAVAWCHEFLNKIKIPELVITYASALADGLRIDEGSLRLNATQAQTKFKKSAPVIQQKFNTRDSQILIYAVRYPERLKELKNIGADMALVSPAAHEFWSLLEKWKPDEILPHLNPVQKEFWQTHRGPASAPLSTADEEFAFLEKELDFYYAASKKVSLSRALAQNAESAGFEEQLAYLRALQETLGEKNE